VTPAVVEGVAREIVKAISRQGGLSVRLVSKKRAFVFAIALVFICVCDRLDAETINIPSIAIGNGIADDTAAIQNAIHRAAAGSTISFGPSSQVYSVSSTLSFPGGVTYNGTGATIQFSGPSTAGAGYPLISLPNGNANNITISGLTFDAGGFGAVMHIATMGSGNTPPQNISITGCTFKNSTQGNTVAPNLGAAIYNTIGILNSTISNNTFSNVAHGISIVNPSALTISGNDFETIESGDGMYFQIFEQLSGLTITNNTGHNFYRMAVEIQTMQVTGSNGQPVTLDNVAIQGNDFENWVAGGDYGFGFSLVFTSPTICNVSGNKLLNGLSSYGIEDGSAGCVVASNTISGFSEGIAITSPKTIVRGNIIANALDSGIQITNANNEINSQIIGNTITNAQNAGIAMVQGDHHGSVFQGNTITRQAGAWLNDATNTFQGIVIAPGLRAPISVSGNAITQTAAVPPAGFSFWGIGVYGDISGTVYSGNSVASHSRAPMGIGFDLSGGAWLNGDVVENTSLTNLQRASNGYTSSQITIANNVACNVVVSDVYLITSHSCNGSSGLTLAITSPSQNEMTAGPHLIKMEYFKRTEGPAIAQLSWAQLQ
jgi:parallel beta-helix repeat protein